jgi:hypothetical protein
MIIINKIKNKVKHILKIFVARIYILKLQIIYFIKKTSNNDISICISTTKGYAEKTIPKLIQDLTKNKIPLNKIFVFEGGYNFNKKNDSVNYNHYFVAHNSFDLTALISILELNIEADNWLLLHDTLEFDNTFKYKFYTINTQKNDCMPLRKFPSMNIGIYNSNYIKDNKDFILSIKNIDYSENSLQKFKALGVDNEDYLFKNTKNKKIIHEKLFVLHKIKEVIYNNNNRILEFYPQLGLKKYKANFKKQEIYTIKL